jgi:hypothetical protein
MIGLEIAYKNESNLQALSLHFHFHFTGFQMWHESSFQWLLTTDRAVALTQRCPRTSRLPDPFPRESEGMGSVDFTRQHAAWPSVCRGTRFPVSQKNGVRAESDHG